MCIQWTAGSWENLHSCKITTEVAAVQCTSSSNSALCSAQFSSKEPVPSPISFSLPPFLAKNIFDWPSIFHALFPQKVREMVEIITREFILMAGAVGEVSPSDLLIIFKYSPHSLNVTTELSTNCGFLPASVCCPWLSDSCLIDQGRHCSRAARGSQHSTSAPLRPSLSFVFDTETLGCVFVWVGDWQGLIEMLIGFSGLVNHVAF